MCIQQCLSKCQDPAQLPVTTDALLFEQLQEWWHCANYSHMFLITLIIVMSDCLKRLAIKMSYF